MTNGTAAKDLETPEKLNGVALSASLEIENTNGKPKAISEKMIMDLVK